MRAALGLLVATLVLAFGVALILGFGALGVACASQDPNWSRPCADEPDASLQVGGGQSEYLPLGDAGVPIEIDTTGTYIWLGVSCQGLGPNVTVTCSIEDTTTGTTVAACAGQAVSLNYDAAVDRDEGWGVIATISSPATVENLIGTNVVITANATGCGRTVQGKTSPSISGFDVGTCQGCLDAACGPEVAACGADCVAIQACLDAYCVHLSALASPDEVTCQTWCQGQHPAGKEVHIALVSCVTASACQPPCNDYSIDYDACVAAVNTASCATTYAACNASADCQTYKDCTSACTTWPTCQQCATAPPKGGLDAGVDGAAPPSGEALFEAYEACVEATCLTLGWLPHE